MHRPLLLSAAIAMATPLPGCQKSETPAPQETQAAPANPDAKPGIAGSSGRLVLPVVAGRPAAVYFTLRNDGSAAATLVGVHVTGAGQAQMHKTEGGAMDPVQEVDIPAGSSVEFAPGGLHVMAFDIAESLQEGGSAELTVTFSDGDKLSMPLRVETMGAGTGTDAAGGASMDDHEDMPGMAH